MISTRQDLQGVKRIVLKIGSSLLYDSPLALPATIADEINQLKKRNLEVIIVSSGAVALGLPALGLTERPRDIPQLQAAAAIGQNKLTQHWQSAFSVHHQQIAQVLLTHDDIKDWKRFLNARYALRTILEAGVIPIINENDTVATEEITVGDNDTLAAFVCNLVSADALLIYTDVNGLHNKHPNQGGRRISLVKDIEKEAIPVAASPSTSGLGRGGMLSKVLAAQSASLQGIPTLIIPGSHSSVLQETLEGKDIGTLFLADKTISSRKHWIAFGVKPKGKLYLDTGATKAILEKGSSLLAVGILSTKGKFSMGDLVSLYNSKAMEFARGLVGYKSDDLNQLCGCRSDEIQAILGYKHSDEVIHRDDLVLTQS